MSRAIPERLLIDAITIRKPVQTFVAGTKKPVFGFQTVASGVKARFNPASTALSRNVLGQTPKRTFKLFVNPVELLENYQVVDEATGEAFVVTEVRNLFGHHLEAVLEEKK